MAVKTFKRTISVKNTSDSELAVYSETMENVKFNSTNASLTWDSVPSGTTTVGFESRTNGEIAIRLPNSTTSPWYISNHWDISDLTFFPLTYNNSNFTYITPDRVEYQILTSSGTWSPPKTPIDVHVQAMGGGGGGGGSGRLSGNGGTAGSGGGSGFVSINKKVEINAPVSYTIGSGGTGGNSVPANAGNAGGQTIFSNVSASGGSGGLGQNGPAGSGRPATAGESYGGGTYGGLGGSFGKSVHDGSFPVMGTGKTIASGGGGGGGAYWGGTGGLGGLGIYGSGGQGGNQTSQVEIYAERGVGRPGVAGSGYAAGGGGAGGNGFPGGAGPLGYPTGASGTSGIIVLKFIR